MRRDVGDCWEVADVVSAKCWSLEGRSAAELLLYDALSALSAGG